LVLGIISTVNLKTNQMKTKQMFIASLCLFALTFVSCNKNQCSNCHYDKAGAEIELGEKCGNEMETLEANGYTDTTGTYTVHCAH
jgi:hypothetical protein